MNERERDRFDELVEEVLAGLPEGITALLDEVPLIVIDRPTPAMMRDLGFDPSKTEVAGELCGLHSGIPDTEASVEHHGVMPSDVHIFRDGVLLAAGGWDAGEEAILDEIEITLLHEIGHQMGLDEDDLERLGYG